MVESKAVRTKICGGRVGCKIIIGKRRAQAINVELVNVLGRSNKEVCQKIIPPYRVVVWYVHIGNSQKVETEENLERADGRYEINAKNSN